MNMVEQDLSRRDLLEFWSGGSGIAVSRWLRTGLIVAQEHVGKKRLRLSPGPGQTRTGIPSVPM